MSNILFTIQCYITIFRENKILAVEYVDMFIEPNKKWMFMYILTEYLRI